MRKGFTLLELIIVIIIIGVLATLGFTQYTKVVEKGRAAEARAILGTLRTAENAYFQEFGVYTATVTELGLELPSAACLTTHYFSYVCDAAGMCTATRCIAGGKTPNAAAPGYNKTLDQAGVFGGTAGY
ncbi:MAG: prepilin-type N-terminal cleavage/methylation domain-containing protein [Candidatus Omnitrophota bacterium]